MLHLPVRPADIEAAALRIAPYIITTPLLPAPVLSHFVGGKVYCKLENLQLTGSFKARGAFHALLQLDEAARKNGVVACSSGNHAQGVALAAKTFGVSAEIIMPSDAPDMKIRGTKELGARVRLYDRNKESREALAAQRVSETGAVFIPPYNHVDVIAGQGSVGREIVLALQERGETPDMLLVPAGGGGLSAGTFIALKNVFPHCACYTVEPKGFEDHMRSFAAGKLVANEKMSGSICDALLSPEPGKITFAITSALTSGGFVVDDRTVMAAMKLAAEALSVVTEPGGAVGLAALLEHPQHFADKTTVVVVSGGNVDMHAFSWIITQECPLDLLKQKT